MNFSFTIENWFALSSGLSTKSDWELWSTSFNHNWDMPLPKTKKIPMMQARRMSMGSRLAVDVGLELIDNHHLDLAIFTSQHGELERTHKILTSMNQTHDISPTDFALSVHNTASGLVTIISNRSIPISSISAHNDSFQQGLIEAFSILHHGNKKVLLVDFDGFVPETYQKQINYHVPAYAVGYILTSGDQLSCQSIDKSSQVYQPIYPQSIAFLHAYLCKQKHFIIQGNSQDWQWTLNQ